MCGSEQIFNNMFLSSHPYDLSVYSPLRPFIHPVNYKYVLSEMVVVLQMLPVNLHLDIKSFLLGMLSQALKLCTPSNTHTHRALDIISHIVSLLAA